MRPADGKAARVLDSWILMGWLKGQQPAAVFMRNLWRRAYARQTRLLLHSVNLGEIFYLTARLKDPETAEGIVQRLMGMPLELVSVSDEHVMAAARLKGQFRISYADAFAVLTAIRAKVPLVTGDPEILALAQRGVLQLEWVG